MQQAKIDQRISDDGSSEENYEVVKIKTKTQTNIGSSSGATTYTATKQFQPNPNFFNDIFNVSLVPFTSSVSMWL